MAFFGSRSSEQMIAAWRTLAHWTEKIARRRRENPELEHCAMPELPAPETTELLCAIIAALIPLLIWAFHDLERRRYGWRHRTRLRRLSKPKLP
jgi:hypothetical protein